MTKRLERARPRREDVRPGRRLDREDARGAARPARRAARVLDDGPGREDHRGHVPDSCSTLAEPGDMIVDGGNSNFRDSQRRYADGEGAGDHVRRRRRLGRHLGARGRLLPDGRRRRRRGRAGSSRSSVDLAPEDGYAHVGAVRRGPLREDGPQRDRVRPDAGLRRGLRGDEGVRVRPRPARDRRHLALRLGRPLVAARAAVRGVREGGRAAREDPRLRRGLGRGPLDDRRGDRRGRARCR